MPENEEEIQFDPGGPHRMGEEQPPDIQPEIRPEEDPGGPH